MQFSKLFIWKRPTRIVTASMGVTNTAVNLQKSRTTEVSATLGKRPRTIELRVKIRSLAAEARIIRHEEEKLTLPPNPDHRTRFDVRRHLPTADDIDTDRIRTIKPRRRRNHVKYVDLHHHRKQIVGVEARASQIAYGFLRGHTYGTIERAKHTKPPWHLVIENIKSFGNEDIRILKQRFEEFIQEGRNGAIKENFLPNWGDEGSWQGPTR